MVIIGPADVVIEITAVARKRHPLARAAPPIERLLQHTAVNRYLDAMQVAVEE